jgi:hypothetical protein
MVRKLYLVPIIHMSPDMGSLASALDERAVAELGQKKWQQHKQIVSCFWDSISQFFASLDVNGFKIYQDGLVTDGDEGLRIVSRGIEEKSRNYKIISHLLEGGAILVRTEDISLVKKEYGFITKMAQANSLRQRKVAALRYKLARGNLLQQRDKFIAMRINETLREGETGILFIGAYHNVLPALAADIKVVQIKEVAKVQEYHRVLINKGGNHDQYFQQLSEYLVSPVSSAWIDCP